MTRLLEKAMDEVAALPEDQQDVFAQWMLEELEAEQRWDRAFAQSSDTLAKLAMAALEEDEAGQTKALDPDSM